MGKKSSSKSADKNASTKAEILSKAAELEAQKKAAQDKEIKASEKDVESESEKDEDEEDDSKSESDLFGGFMNFVVNTTTLTGVSDMLAEVQDHDISILAYDGFDPVALLRQFYEIAVANELSETDAIQDIIDLVSTGLMRGNIRSDQRDKTSARGKKRIQELAKRYNIPERKIKGKKVVMSKTTMTFVRAISTFPVFAAALLYHRPTIVDKNQLGNECGAIDCPNILRHTGAGSLIPRMGIFKVYLVSHVAYMLELGLLIDPKAHEKEFATRYNEQKKYADNAQKSNLIKEVERLGIFMSVNLLSKINFAKALKCFNTVGKLLGWPEQKIDDFEFKEDLLTLTYSADDLQVAKKSAESLKKKFNLKFSETADEVVPVPESSTGKSGVAFLESL